MMLSFVVMTLGFITPLRIIHTMCFCQRDIQSQSLQDTVKIWSLVYQQLIPTRNAKTGKETDSTTGSATYPSLLLLIFSTFIFQCTQQITHPSFSIHKAAAWTPRPVEDILDKYHDGLFTSPYPNTHKEIPPDDLNDIPFISDDGFELPLFSKDGFQIQRRSALFNRNVKPHGILVDLLQTKNLFTNDVDELFDKDPCSIDFTGWPKNSQPFSSKRLGRRLLPVHFPCQQASKTNSK